MQQPFERELASGDEAFDEDAVVRLVPLGANVRRLQERAQPVEGAAKSGRGSSARITPRLPDSATGLTTHGNASDLASARGFASIATATKPRHRQTGVAKPLARALLVARDRRGLGGWPGSPSASRDARGDHRRPVADREDAVERRARAAATIAADRAVFVVEPDRNRLVPPRILEHVAPIGREHQLDAEPLGRLAERARLISGRRRQEENARHLSTSQAAFSTDAPQHWHPSIQHPAPRTQHRARQIIRISSGFGSAQQYHGSFRYGTAVGRSGGPDIAPRRRRRARGRAR